MMTPLLELVRSARHCVALTGAGVSTLSGIPDFRGPQGLYHQPDVDADRLFDIREFTSDPSYFYTHAAGFLYTMTDKQPSLVHARLAEWEKEGLIRAVITQNIDRLHQRAGSRRVLELHGSPECHHCLECGREYPFDAVQPTVVKGEIPHCECGGVLKPDVVFFGEMLPQDVLAEAEAEAWEADLMLVLGTSLTVYPAAALPGIILQAGGNVAIVNAGATPLDQDAIYREDDLSAAFA